MTKRNRGKTLPIRDLQEYIISKLGDSVVNYSDPSSKPIVIEVNKPSYRKYRVYAFNCGNPPGGRPIDEYKIVLNVGQEYGKPGNFDYSEGCFAIVVGYVNQLDVFVLWDPSKHKDFAYNKNMQVKAETILNALASPLSLQKRRTNNGEEVIIAGRSEYLIDALNKRIELLYKEMVGE
jgi:hypothetical protein